MALLITVPIASGGPWLLSNLHAADSDSPVDHASELQLISDDFELADGPAWDGRWALYVPDVKRMVLRRFVPARNEWQTVSKGTDRISASFYSHGRLFVSNNSGAKIEAFDGNSFAAGTKLITLIDESEKPKKRPNDLVVDHHGGIYFTLTGQNLVVYVDPNGQSQVVTEEVVTPNGITLSPDNRTLYVAAYRPKKILAFPLVQPGVAGKGREFATMDDGEALGADGMSIDRAGNVYCAGATDVWIWNPAGKLVDKIACPTRPINCAFGDQNLRTLYITGFGGLYSQQMRVTGIPPQPPTDAALLPNDSVPDTSIPESVKAHLDVPYATYESRTVLADIFVPAMETAGGHPAVVVVHGGGWQNGDKAKFRALAIDLAKRGFVSAAIEYRLANDTHFPAAMHDCSAAVRFLRASADTYGINPKKIAAIGGSAGGHLVGLMASGWNNPELHGAGGHPDESSQLQLAIVMAGPLQIATGSVAERSLTAKDSNAVRWFGGTIKEQRELYELADAHLQISANTCPIFFLTGEHDNPDRNQSSRDKLQKLNIPTGLLTYKGGKHGCWNRQPWFDRMNDDIERLLREHLK